MEVRLQLAQNSSKRSFSRLTQWRRPRRRRVVRPHILRLLLSVSAAYPGSGYGSFPSRGCHVGSRPRIAQIVHTPDRPFLAALFRPSDIPIIECCFVPWFEFSVTSPAIIIDPARREPPTLQIGTYRCTAEKVRSAIIVRVLTILSCVTPTSRIFYSPSSWTCPLRSPGRCRHNRSRRRASSPRSVKWWCARCVRCRNPARFGPIPPSLRSSTESHAI